ncbi:DUF6941 family protein [Actinomadura chokoriensis]|uniref:DUF6941 family protein n=1 Tax=Actinomadura chokoriensis TaxID=454156 RepID=UPI0031F836DC
MSVEIEELQLILCDSASNDPSGKIHMLGAGWSMTGTPTAPHAVVLMLRFPHDHADQKISLQLSLLNDNGEPVVVGPADQAAPITVHGSVEVPVCPDVPDDLSRGANFTVAVGPMPLPEGRYQWRLDIEGHTKAVRFAVLRPSQKGAPA